MSNQGARLQTQMLEINVVSVNVIKKLQLRKVFINSVNLKGRRNVRMIIQKGKGIMS
jgi:hypothetical protein